MQDWLHWQDPFLHRNRNSKNDGYASNSDCNYPGISVFSVQTIRDELHQRDADPTSSQNRINVYQRKGYREEQWCWTIDEIHTIRFCSSGCGCSRDKTFNSAEKSTVSASLLPDTTKNCTSATGVGSLDSIMAPVV